MRHKLCTPCQTSSSKEKSLGNRGARRETVARQPPGDSRGLGSSRKQVQREARFLRREYRDELLPFRGETRRPLEWSAPREKTTFGVKSSTRYFPDPPAESSWELSLSFTPFSDLGACSERRFKALRLKSTALLHHGRRATSIYNGARFECTGSGRSGNGGGAHNLSRFPTWHAGRLPAPPMATTTRRLNQRRAGYGPCFSLTPGRRRSARSRRAAHPARARAAPACRWTRDSTPRLLFGYLCYLLMPGERCSERSIVCE